MHKFIVVGIGEILWDMLPSGKQLGGAPANFAWFAKALGAEAYVVSRVGGDRLGREILNKLDKMGLGRKYIADDRLHPTGSVDVQLDKNGQPSYVIKQNVAWDFVEFSPALRLLAGKTDAACFGTLAQRSGVTRATIRKFLASMPAKSLKVFDVNLRQSFYNRKIIAQLFKLANVVKLNDEELVVVADMFSIRGDERKIVERLIQDYQFRVVAITKGAKGAVLYCPQGAYPAQGRKVKIADTVGAGDSFTAALVVGLLNGAEMRTIGARAARLAEYVCRQPGATPVLSVRMVKNMKALNCLPYLCHHSR